MKMLKFVKQIFISTMMLFDSLLNVNLLECISLKNQECKIRPEIVNISSNNIVFYPFSIKVNKCSGNCNNINNPYLTICVPDVIKNLNVKVFNLMTLTNEMRHVNGINVVSVYVDQIELFAIVNNNGMKTNTDVNVKN